ncbi:hypothetical protein [Agarilytica rhodophyticola]|uniref:hypothetical protein n=1 Tax=Agarilytica rhodophyticola TaxID=1737490 RepID=UPI000B34756A|nr:hypothetical protein [Agarilytica rhodophyticola]
MNKKAIATLCLVLSISNAFLANFLMDIIFGKGNAAPIWADYLFLIYILVPMGYAYKLIINSFGKK